MHQLNHRDEKVIGRFGTLVTWLSFSTLGVIVLGSWVRAADAGLACPDWPLCYGTLVPAFDYQIFLEWFHRLVAGMLGVAMIYALVMVAKNKILRKVFGLQFAVASMLLVSQIILGGLTVLHLLKPSVVSMHLLNGTVFFMTLIWIALRARRLTQPELRNTPETPPALKFVFVSFAVMLFIQIMIGGMVSSNFAGLACPDFPTCHGSWLPKADFPVLIQMTHRYVGIAVALVGISLAFLGSARNLAGGAGLAVRLIPRLVFAQVLLGVINVIYLLPDWASVLHLANAEVLMALAFIGTYEVLVAGKSPFTQSSDDDLTQTTLASADGALQ